MKITKSRLKELIKEEADSIVPQLQYKAPVDVSIEPEKTDDVGYRDPYRTGLNAEFFKHNIDYPGLKGKMAGMDLLRRDAPDWRSREDMTPELALTAAYYGHLRPNDVFKAIRGGWKGPLHLQSITDTVAPHLQMNEESDPQITEQELEQLIKEEVSGLLNEMWPDVLAGDPSKAPDWAKELALAAIPGTQVPRAARLGHRGLRTLYNLLGGGSKQPETPPPSLKQAQEISLTPAQQRTVGYTGRGRTQSLQPAAPTTPQPSPAPVKSDPTKFAREFPKPTAAQIKSAQDAVKAANLEKYLKSFEDLFERNIK